MLVMPTRSTAIQTPTRKRIRLDGCRSWSLSHASSMARYYRCFAVCFAIAPSNVSDGMWHGGCTLLEARKGECPMATPPTADREPIWWITEYTVIWQEA